MAVNQLVLTTVTVSPFGEESKADQVTTSSKMVARSEELGLLMDQKNTTFKCPR